MDEMIVLNGDVVVVELVGGFVSVVRVAVSDFDAVAVADVVEIDYNDACLHV